MTPSELSQVEVLAEVLAAQERIHRIAMRDKIALIHAQRRLMEEHGLLPPDELAAEEALNQFHRLRNALERVYIWFDGHGGVPPELKPYFMGTILT